jgi:tight adherence protein C
MTRTILAAVLLGIAAAALTLAARPPTRRLAPRVAPYAQRARLAMGRPADPSLLTAPNDQRHPIGTGVFSPLWHATAQRLSSLIDLGGDDTLALRLRQAGWRHMTPDHCRLRQLGSTAQGLGLFVAIALVAAPSGPTVLLAAALGAIWGTTRWRTRIDKTIEARRQQIRAELYTVAQLLAISLRAGTSPHVALNELVSRARGPVSDELSDALDAIHHGATTRSALERLATQTPEPAAARLYRLIATADTGSGDTLADALLHTANDLRAQRREDIERLATRRRFQTLIPTILVMGPVMLLFLASPIPTLIFGDN